MKKLVYLFLGLSLVFVSCSKDDDGGDGGSAAEGQLKATVDGNSFSSMEIATTAVEQTAGGITTIMIQGSNADGKGISITISGFDGVGTYDLGGGANIYSTAIYTEANINDPMNSKTWVAPYDETVAGEVKISEKTDAKIKGTFSFKAKDEENGTFKEISSGSFNVSF